MPRHDLRVLDHLAERLDGLAGHRGFREPVEPVGGRAFAEAGGYAFQDLLAPLAAAGVGRQVGSPRSFSRPSVPQKRCHILSLPTATTMGRSAVSKGW